MSETSYNVGIRFNADGSGLVGEAKDAEKALGGVEAATQRLNAASKAGREAAIAARQADAARRFESSEVQKQLEDTSRAQAEATTETQKYVQRLKEQAETLGMSKLQIEQYRAAQLDMNATQRASVDASLATVSAHEKQQKAIAEMTGLATKAAIAAVALGAAFTYKVGASVNASAALQTLSEKTGIAVEQLAKLKYAADLSDTSIESLARAMSKLPRSIIEGGNSNSDAGRAFAFLGIDPAKLHTQEQAIDAIANAIRRVEDPMAKSAALQMIFKRNGEELIPFFNQGADGIRRMGEQGERWNTVSGTSAEQAKKLKDDLVELKYSSDALAKSIGIEVVPWASKMIEQFLEGKKAAGGLYNALMMFGTINPFKSTGENLTSVRKRIDELESEKDGLLTPNAAARLDVQIAEQRKKLEFLKLQQRQEVLAGGADFPDQNSRYAARVASGRKIRGMPDGKGGAGDSGNENAEFDRIRKLEVEQAGVLAAQLAGTEKLTASEQRRAKILADLNEGLAKLNPVQREQVLSLLDGNIALEKQIVQRDKAKVAAAAATKEIERLVKERHREEDAQRRQLSTVEDQNNRLAEHNEAIGLTSDQLAQLRIKRAEDALAIARQNEMMAKLDERFEGSIVLMEARTRAAERFVQLTREGAAAEAAVDQRRRLADAMAEQQRRQAEDIKRNADNMERALTDSIMRGFEKGKPFVQTFWDSLVAASKTAVLTPIIQPIVRPIAQMAGGVISGVTSSLFPGAASAASAAGGIGNLAGGGASIANWFGGGTMAAGANALPGVLGTGVAEEMAALGIAQSSGAGLGAGLAAIPGWGWAALAAGALIGGSALFGKRGGPKASWLNLVKNGPGDYGIGNSDVVSGPDYAALKAMEAQLNDASKYDPDKLDQFVGRQFSTGSAADTSALLSLMTQQLAPAADSAKELAEQTAILKAQTDAAAAAAEQAAAAIERQKRALDIELMEATGDAAGALAARREDELAAMDATLRGQQQQIYAARDLAEESRKAAQAERDLASARSALATVERSLQSSVSSLPGQLGITQLEQYRASLGVSEFVSPLDRAAEARRQMEETFGRASGGDLSAVQAFPQALQSALSISRDVFASGPQFQELFTEGNRKLNDLLERQQGLQLDILKDVPLAIREAANDQIAELRSGFRRMVDEVSGLRAELRRLTG